MKRIKKTWALELSINLDFAWWFFYSYEWSESTDKAGIGMKVLSPVKDPYGAKSTFIKPFEHNTLFARFADIGTSAEDYLEWAETYGTLLLPSEKSPWTNSLAHWYQAHRELAFAFLLWELFSENDPCLEKIIKISPGHRIAAYPITKQQLKLENFEMDQSCEPTILSADIYPWIELKCPDVHEATQFLVKEMITENLKRYPLHVFLYTDQYGVSQRKMEPTSLLSAMWYQMYLLVTGEIEIRRCALCGKWEDMNGHRRNWTKHPGCAGYGRLKRARAKKNQQKQQHGNENPIGEKSLTGPEAALIESFKAGFKG